MVGMFQHTAARRRLAQYASAYLELLAFQHTAARRRLDGMSCQSPCFLCFNTQPPEGGWRIATRFVCLFRVSTHSRPKAAGTLPMDLPRLAKFQHTAARRRLVYRQS